MAVFTNSELEFVTDHRVARLATADADGMPHVVPVCYATNERRIYTAIDSKPKRFTGKHLKRVRNVISNPYVSLVIDDYCEDWSKLKYVLIKGSAEFLEAGSERSTAETLLRKKYHQYGDYLDPGSPIISITPTKIISWNGM